MAVIEWIRFLFGALFLLCGLLIFLIEMVGVHSVHHIAETECTPPRWEIRSALRAR